jgi:hypothetical protein
MADIYIDYKKSDTIVTYKLNAYYLYSLVTLVSFGVGYDVTKVIYDL